MVRHRRARKGIAERAMVGLARPLIVVAFALILVAACADESTEGGDVALPITEVTTTEAPQAQVNESRPDDTARPPGTEQPFQRLPGLISHHDYEAQGQGAAAWRNEVARIEEVRIASSADGNQQPAMWLPPTGEGDRPLLVGVHSWSSDHTQAIGIPYGMWADQHGWAMIHPNFRGRYRTPESTGSELVVSDVIDAIDFAIAQGGVDPDRVYITGFSGGGLTTLLMAGRHSERFAGAAAFVPIDDLVAWYEYNAVDDTRYAREIAASCGGDPTVDPAAAAECRQRSPAEYLDDAAAADLPIYIAHGIDDDVVPPTHSLRAFDRVADPDDRLDAALLQTGSGAELRDLVEGRVEAPTWFGPEDPEVVFSQSSGQATLVLFEGGHQVVYHPGLAWIYDLAAGEVVDP